MPGIAASALAAAKAAYGRIPVLPFLDRPTSAIFIFAVSAYAIFVAAMIFSSPPGAFSGELFEGPISKNAGLRLLPGESYSYELSGAGENPPVLYEIGRSSSCAGVLVTEGKTGSAACLSKEGNLLEEGFPLINSSFGNKSMLLFAPWMLAASDSFGWQIKTTIRAGLASIEVPVQFKSLGTRKIAGRSAYEISVESEIASPARYFIDSQKRVLLLLDAGNFSAKLTSAPFWLNWTEED